jgi:DNA-binding HxlR family transcriptional regulator
LVGPVTTSAMGIASKVLIQTLPALERDGLVSRTAYDESPPRVEYELTPLGLSLREPLAAIRQWAAAHSAGDPGRTRSSRLGVRARVWISTR